MNGIIIGTTIPCESEPGSNGNKDIDHTSSYKFNQMQFCFIPRTRHI